ncbi:MAG: TIGR00282 family metallophosphoesterase [Patescibacteria group bacterium]|jgi:metallophosphoesterase (TIGR00282 family)
MKILYLGDIMGPMGIQAVKKFLPQIEKLHKPDLIITQAENVTNGKGISNRDYKLLKGLGVNGFTGGNWTMHNKEIFPALNQADEPIVRPANYPIGTQGKPYKILQAPAGAVLLVSLLGSIVGKDSDAQTDNPLKTIDAILSETKHINFAAKLVNFHGDFSSEKRVIGYYLDGRVSMVVGDHWHVPSADAMVLPNGTAHISDVGMCGSLHSSLGVELDVIISRWRDGKVQPNKLESSGPLQINAVLVDVNTKSGLADNIQSINFKNQLT